MKNHHTKDARRVGDWNERLVAYANSVNGAPFQWGVTDCASLVRYALRAMYGRDLLRGMGSYRSSPSALRVGRQVGPVGAYLRDRGFQAVGLAFAQSGDTVVFRGLDRGHPQLGVVVSGRLLVSDPDTDVVLHRLPIGAWPKGTKLWRAPQ